jgi:4-hydroxybenzoate polyprenyltransferase
MALAYALTVYYARGGEVAGFWRQIELSTAALALVIAAAYVLNDVWDSGVDRRAGLDRPIAAGRTSRRAGALWGGGLMAAGLALGAACRWEFLAALAGVAAGLVIYDLLSKRVGVGKQILVAALMTSIYPLALAEAGGAVGRRAGSLAIFPIWLFMTAFGYEVLKDLRDRTTDPPVGGRETAIQRRPDLWRRVAGVAIVGAAPLLVGPYLTGCGWVYLAIATVGAGLALASVFLPVRWAICCVYAECFVVGLAATVDVIVFGI